MNESQKRLGSNYLFVSDTTISEQDGKDIEKECQFVCAAWVDKDNHKLLHVKYNNSDNSEEKSKILNFILIKFSGRIKPAYKLEKYL